MSQYLEQYRQSPDELYHHGIKGQHWGVRRFQNADGSLTLRGKKRYGSWDEKKSTYLQKQKLLNDANKGAAKADSKASKYMEKANNALTDHRRNRFLDKATNANLDATFNRNAAIKIQQQLAKPGANEPSKGNSLFATKKPDGTLTEHGKKALQRQEIKADKIKERVDKYERRKVEAMGKSYKAFTKFGENYQRARAFDAQMGEITFRDRGIKVVDKMTSKFGDSYVEPKYQAMGQEYMSKLSDIYNERINFGRK